MSLFDLVVVGNHGAEKVSGTQGLFTHTISVPSPSPSPSKFNTVPMVTDCLTERMGPKLILSVNVNLTVTVMEMGTETLCINGPLFLPAVETVSLHLKRNPIKEYV